MSSAELVMAREVGASRQAQARASALTAAVRLARREQRLQRRLERVHSQLSDSGLSN